MKRRREVEEFADWMERQLRAHDICRGDSWKRTPVGLLLDHLDTEVKELRDAVSEGRDSIDVVGEAADVANLAMMIVDRYDIAFLAALDQATQAGGI